MFTEKLQNLRIISNKKWEKRISNEGEGVEKTII